MPSYCTRPSSVIGSLVSLEEGAPRCSSDTASAAGPNSANATVMRSHISTCDGNAAHHFSDEGSFDSHTWLMPTGRGSVTEVLAHGSNSMRQHWHSRRARRRELRLALIQTPSLAALHGPRLAVIFTSRTGVQELDACRISPARPGLNHNQGASTVYGSTEVMPCCVFSTRQNCIRWLNLFMAHHAADVIEDDQRVAAVVAHVLRD